MNPFNRHRIWQLAADAALIAAAWWLAFQLRFDFEVPIFFRHMLWETILIVVAIKLAVFVGFGFYNRWWRYVSTRDMWRAAMGVTAASAIAAVAIYFGYPVERVRLPRGVALADLLLLLAFVTGSRLLARTVIERPASGRLLARGREVLIVGAGDAGRLILDEIQRSRAVGYTPMGLIDDDPRKKGMKLRGVKVLGTTEELRHVLRDNRPDEILIAIPSAPGELRRRVVEAARAENVPVKTLPGLYELISGDLDLAGQIRPVQVEDVLGREPVEVDLDAIATFLAGETVLVTGAGGSIGSELCRQIARLAPARLILVDHAEPALFEIERELVGERGFKACFPILADVKSRAKIRQVFERYAPTIVFHAAAYKHVGLMEANPLEAVRNNTLATKVLAEEAADARAKRFVLVSTDKAANPKNMMGQSKALCEWIVEAYGARADIQTRFCAVRFGNVLGSSGSVIPIFRRQIAKGGPVTVTHPDMTRYFMTIPEAVALVIQAAAIGGQGHVYVLDMGEPVKILELARNMIRLSGREPDAEIAIEIVGAKPGEKIEEVLWSDGETVSPTEHPKVLRATRPSIDSAWLEEELADLERLVEAGETLELVGRMGAMLRSPQRGAVSPESRATKAERPV
jgi:FlaA1/EpsC-like NDP-sugar epimerase